MTCGRMSELIPLHAGGDLSLGEAAEVKSHLVGCQGCASLVASHRTALAQLQDSLGSTERVFPGLWAEIEPRLDAVDAAQRLSAPRHRNLFWGMGLVTVAASIALFLPALLSSFQGPAASLVENEVQAAVPLRPLLPIAVASAIQAQSRLGFRQRGQLASTSHSPSEALGIVVQSALEEAARSEKDSGALLVGHPRR